METKPVNDSKVNKSQQKRRPKSGNSDLFNELLSRANALSVAERVRMVKSIAGQLGFVVIKPGVTAPSAKGEANGRSRVQEEIPVVRPNPLRGTQFEKILTEAKAAVKSERERLGVDKLPADSPIMMNYIKALNDYRQEKAKLKPVESVTPAKKSVAKRERSPVPQEKESSSLMDVEVSSTTSASKRQSGSSIVRNAVRNVMGGSSKQ